MAESLVGDITPTDGILKKEKSRREKETMKFLTEGLLGAVGGGGREAGEGIMEVWQEYEDGKTLEAMFVHDVDKLELVLQMMEYERKEEGRVDLGEFVWVSERIVLDEVKEWCAELLKEREEFWRGMGKGVTGLKGGRQVIEAVERQKAKS
ncbi:MAG: hypothetical protein Q9187_005549 [Circinaria calcarea]